MPARSLRRARVRAMALAVSLLALVVALPVGARASGSLALDDFDRSVVAGWGQATVGGRYLLTGGGPGYSVRGGKARMALDEARPTRSAVLSAVEARDVDVRVRIDPGTAPGSIWAMVLARRVREGYAYRARVRFLPDGGVQLRAVAVTGRDTRALGTPRSVADAYQVGTPTWLRVRVTGARPTTIRMRVWRAGTAEPTGWHVRVADSTPALQHAGALGVRAHMEDTAGVDAATVAFDRLRAERIATGGTPPIIDRDPGPAPGGDPAPAGRYVSPTGSDDAPGTFEQPWRTLQHAADVAVGAVWVRDGRYAGFKVRRPGITFRAYPGETPVIAGGPDTVNVVWVYRTRAITIQGFTVTGASVKAGAGIHVSESDDVLIADNVIRDNTSYGIRTWHATNVVIRRNEVTGNEEGMRISYTAGGTRVLDNDVHHNDHLVVNTASPANDDHGAVGIVFLKTTGPVLARGNRVWGNRGPSHDYGYDGGAFEIFGASDVTITGNLMWDNKHVMETGTADGYECRDVTFTRNVAYAASSVEGWARGLLLACASDSLVAHNTLIGFDVADLSVVHKQGYEYQGSLDGLRVLNNVFVSDGPAVYYLDHVPSGVTIDHNLAWNKAGGTMVYVVGTGSRDWAGLRSMGFEAHGVNADPRFVDGSSRDYHLRADSPAIDEGRELGGSYQGAAPDLGRYERD
jgi:parallel beta-helix repeat protein